MNFRWPSFIRNDRTGDPTQGKSWIDYITEKVHFDKKQHVSSLGNELYKKEESYISSQSNLIKEEKKEKDATKNLLMHFSSNTSLHGVRNIADSNNTLLRLFYIGIVASFMIIVSYYLIKLFMIYNSHPVNRQYTASLQEKLMFPGITMCDFHPYNLRNQSIISALLDGLRARNYTNPVFSLEEKTIYTLIYADQNEDMESKFNSNELCADDWSFRWMVIDNDILKCYTFNTVNKTEPHITNKPGIKYGLEIVRNFSALYSDYTTGVRIFVHSPFKRAYEQDCSFFAGPGLSTFAIIHPLKLTLLGYPFHPIEEDCVLTEKQSLLDDTGSYSQVNCEEKCRVDFIIHCCNCSPSFAGGSLVIWKHKWHQYLNLGNNESTKQFQEYNVVLLQLYNNMNEKPGSNIQLLLREQLSGCSQQRLRALQVSLRRYGNDELRISAKDLHLAMQENDIYLTDRAMTEICMFYQDSLGINYQGVYDCLMETHATSGW
ncbi:microtubule-associated 2-like 4 isoform X2 [Octopus vulgaris]|uniref:Microtubule-associated 2-like 4 isoform X2 n=1 Tax=Octopus vulgaris TaxID=6645 RepID=A0AA36BGH3_OCTVU|nr:microtubule-associated 2-like 4 isoform X2 [Octopus vulgaris]